MYIIFPIVFIVIYYKLLNIILCHIVGPYCLSVFYIVVLSANLKLLIYPFLSFFSLWQLEVCFLCL